VIAVSSAPTLLGLALPLPPMFAVLAAAGGVQRVAAVAARARAR
jgi:hypothetical protein